MNRRSFSFAVSRIWAVILFGAFCADAQIEVGGSATHTQISSAVNTLEDYTTPIGLNRKMVVTVSMEGSASITNINYGDQTLTEMITAANGSSRKSSIWYLDGPAMGTRDLTVSFSAPASSIIGVASLENTAPGPATQTASATWTTTLGLTTPSDDTLVVGVYTSNGGGAPSSTFSNTIYSAGAGATGHSGYQNEPSAGVKSYSWTAANNAPVAVLAAFDYEEPTITFDPQAIDFILADTTNRQLQILADQVAKPYPSDPSSFWRYEDFALGAYWLNTNTAEADAGLIACQTNGLYQERIDLGEFHWQAHLLERIYFLFSGQSEYFPGRMSASAEDAVLEMLWDWAAPNCKIGMADPETVFYSWASENHGAQAWVSFWGAAQIFANHPYYQTLTYADGTTPAEMAVEFNAYYKARVRARSLKGTLIEVGSPSYAKYTLSTWLNLADFASDPELKAAASSLLDIFWANWAMEQIDGVRGGSRHRAYTGSTSITSPGGGNGHAWFYFGLGTASKHPGDMSAATTFWRPSRATVGLALDTEGRGVYSYASRRLGHKDPSPPPEPPGPEGYRWNPLDPDGGHLLRYTWCTPDFVMGMSQVDVLPADDWIPFSSQNRWNGVIFGGHDTARIFTQRPLPADGSNYNEEWGVQNKGTMILQRITTANAVPGQMVWFDFSLNRQESGGWIFAEAPGAFAAVRIVTGGWSWQPDSIDQQRQVTSTNIGEWAVLNNQYSPVIIEVARKRDYADMAAFQSEILNNPLVWDGSRLDYTSQGYDTTLTLFANESALPRVDGTPIDLAPTKNYDAPYLQGDFAGGPVIINYRNDRTVHGVAPFADDADTIYHWDFETTLPTINTASTNSIELITDGKFGGAMRCNFEAGDQYMMNASPWPATQGNVRYRGWFRLNPGDTGGHLFHVYDQVYLSVNASTATFKINRSGVVADSSATNEVQLSASISTSNEWQYIEALYDGQQIKLVTAEETVSAPGIGAFIPNDRAVTVGSRKNKNNYVGDMDEVIVSVLTTDPVVPGNDAQKLGSAGVNTIYGFTPLMGDHAKLVVCVSWEGVSTALITNVTYGSQVFTEAVTQLNGRHASIWYLDEPQVASGDVTVQFSGGTDSRIGVLSLGNVAPGAPEVTAALPGSTVISLTNQIDKSLVLGVYTENGGGSLSSGFANTLYSGSSGSSVGNAGYQVEAMAGAKTYTWTAATNGCAVVAASFAPAPATLPPLADVDADGMADEWELQHFGTMGASGGTSDADGDGFTDAQESIAGTDPWDAASRLELTGFDGGTNIFWQAVQGKSYRVLSSTNLMGGAWMEEASGIPGTPPESSYGIPLSSEQLFLRIETE